ncbi:MAG: LptF/LptG family permease [Phycisphaerae bacterium]|nr:LptF/LptG family permease [Tepidisphaeraceae bacterium]
MSKTLFWYLLKDLLRIFLLASGTLAGIMSFGALLRPLTQHGLDAAQIGKILSYFSPAMTTYSFPVAALFATTFVYGRLSADNELTACRASGLSHLVMTLPAFLLGLIVALISLLFLCFVVPTFTLKVEKVIYSNIAGLVANKITRTHEISYGKTTIFAQEARALPPVGSVLVVAVDDNWRGAVEKRLAEVGLTFKSTAEGLVVDYVQGDSDIRGRLTKLAADGQFEPAEGLSATVQRPWGATTTFRVPVGLAVLGKDPSEADRRAALGATFETALSAAVRVLPSPDAQAVDLTGPMVFSYQTVPVPDYEGPASKKEGDKADKASKMRVPTKVWMARQATAYIVPKDDNVEMTVVLAGAGNFTRGAGGTQSFVELTQFGPVPINSPIRENTKFMDIVQLRDLLAKPEESKRLQGLVRQFIADEQREMYFEQITAGLTANKSFPFVAETEELVVRGDLTTEARAGELVLTPQDRGERVTVERSGEGGSTDRAVQVRITMEVLEHTPENPDPRLLITVRGYDVVIESDAEMTRHEKYSRAINIPMPADLRKVESHNVEHYLKGPAGERKVDRESREKLKTEYTKLTAMIRSEMHARASFAVSCLILVMVGCALGMVSKSGNFLSAFAVSVVPALLCITLVVTGQHVCEATPKSIGLGLGLIWSGNIAVASLGVVLLGGLQRQ